MELAITDQIINNAAHLRDEIGVELAFGLSGSHARGTADALSDVDICVFIERSYPSRENQQIQSALLYEDRPESLRENLLEIESLFRDTAACIKFIQI